MKISIIIPTFNNLNYLKFFLTSVKNNSVYNHQVILHINDGLDGTLILQKRIIYYLHIRKKILVYVVL